MYSKILLFLAILITNSSTYGQEVRVSKDFNLKNDFAYEILGKVDQNVVLFRDGGFDYSLELLDDELVYKKKTEVFFEKSKVNIIDIVSLDSLFCIYYSYKNEGSNFLASRTFNSKLEPIDSTSLFVEKSRLQKRNFNLIASEDKSKVLIYSLTNSKMINLIAIDQKKNKVLYDDEVDYGEFDLRDDLRSLLITNSAEVYLLVEKNNRRLTKEKHFVELNYIHPESSDILYSRLNLKDKLCSDVEMYYDNLNRNILIAGLFHDKNKISSKGYFYALLNPQNLTSKETPVFRNYDNYILKEVFGAKKSKEKSLQYYKLKDVVFRNDGGFLLITEMNKELARRNYYNGYNRFTNDNIAAVWKDFYNENIILFAVKPNGKQHWSKVLHKKQFSQDDDNIYGSFFAFQTPSRLRFLYNDEIKKNSLVSEYVIDPLGDFERNAVLSTDYQNLRLRFKDAVQLSSNEILVPSQRNYTLNLVKISY